MQFKSRKVRKKRVALIGTAGVPARYGGFETLVHHLIPYLKEHYNITVYCSNSYYKKEERISSWNGAELKYLPLNANGAQSIPYDLISMLHALFFADTMVILGVSGGILIPFIKIFTRKKIIINIDGLEWRRAKWNKYVRKFLKFSERLAVKFSDIDITDNLSIKKYTAINYHTLSTLIEYGADHVMKVDKKEEDLLNYPFLNSNYAFKVCRIEPENNVHIIIEAFSRQRRFPLVMVGNWNKSNYGQSLKQQYERNEHIYLLDPIYDQQGLDLLRSNAYLYVHGHSAGGTNPSLVEAMYLNLAVIAYDVSYNQTTTEHQAIYFKNADSLLSILECIESEEVQALKKRMKTIADRRYTWKTIALKYQNAIRSFDFNYSKNSTKSEAAKMKVNELQEFEAMHLKKTKMFYE